MELEEYKNENNEELVPVETIVADIVADEILFQDEEDRKPFLLLLILIFCLIFLGSAITIAVVSPGMNSKSTNVINAGSILFSYSQNHYIEINNAFPISDEYGKNLSGENEFFDFVISVDFVNTKKKDIQYEISVLPFKENTLDAKYVRIYLVENDKEVGINNKIVNKFSELRASEFNKGAKFLYKVSTTKKVINNYVFRMWLSEEYNVSNEVKTFKCSIIINAY